MRGSSGARFSFVDGTVWKRGNQRVVAQGEWLRLHPLPVLPEVSRVTDDGYEMEQLVSAPPWVLDHRTLLEQMLVDLSVQIWSRPPEVKLDPLELRNKVNALLDRFVSEDDPARRLVNELFYRIKWYDLECCLTHGDPTFDNVMFREETGRLVLIDPVPATPAVPDIRVVDLGKIMQSALGWEKVRYGSEEAQFVVSPLTLRNRIPLDNEWLGTVFWGVVHILRTLPYVSTDVHSELKRVIRGAARLV